VVRVALGGVIGVVFFAVKRIMSYAGGEPSPGAIHDGDPNAEGTEIYAGD